MQRILNRTPVSAISTYPVPTNQEDSRRPPATSLNTPGLEIFSRSNGAEGYFMESSSLCVQLDVSRSELRTGSYLRAAPESDVYVPVSLCGRYGNRQGARTWPASHTQTKQSSGLNPEALRNKPATSTDHDSLKSLLGNCVPGEYVKLCEEKVLQRHMLAVFRLEKA